LNKKSIFWNRLLLFYIVYMSRQTKDKSEDFSSQEVEKIKDKGRRIGFFLAKLGLDPEVKQELASLISQMSLEQIGRLEEILEAKYVFQSTFEVEKKYKKEIENLVKELKEEREKLKSDFEQKFEKFSKNLKV